MTTTLTKTDASSNPTSTTTVAASVNNNQQQQQQSVSSSSLSVANNSIVAGGASNHHAGSLTTTAAAIATTSPPRSSSASSIHDIDQRHHKLLQNIVKILKINNVLEQYRSVVQNVQQQCCCRKTRPIWERLNILEAKYKELISVDSGRSNNPNGNSSSNTRSGNNHHHTESGSSHNHHHRHHDRLQHHQQSQRNHHGNVNTSFTSIDDHSSHKIRQSKPSSSSMLMRSPVKLIPIISNSSKDLPSGSNGSLNSNDLANKNGNNANNVRMSYVMMNGQENVVNLVEDDEDDIIEEDDDDEDDDGEEELDMQEFMALTEILENGQQTFEKEADAKNSLIYVIRDLNSKEIICYECTYGGQCGFLSRERARMLLHIGKHYQHNAEMEERAAEEAEAAAAAAAAAAAQETDDEVEDDEEEDDDEDDDDDDDDDQDDDDDEDGDDEDEPQPQIKLESIHRRRFRNHHHHRRRRHLTKDLDISIIPVDVVDSGNNSSNLSGYNSDSLVLSFGSQDELKSMRNNNKTQISSPTAKLFKQQRLLSQQLQSQQYSSANNRLQQQQSSNSMLFMASKSLPGSSSNSISAQTMPNNANHSSAAIVKQSVVTNATITPANTLSVLDVNDNSNPFMNSNNSNIQKPIKCDWEGCTFMCDQNYKLRTHTRQVHEKVRPYLCDWPGCFGAYKTRSNLASHRMVHTGERPYICDHPKCGAKFARKYDCERHRRIHSEKMYPCEWPGCGKRLCDPYNLERHMMVHKGELPFRCPVGSCVRGFRELRYLRDHMVNSHKFLPDTNQLRMACCTAITTLSNATNKMVNIVGYNLNDNGNVVTNPNDGGDSIDGPSHSAEESDPQSAPMVLAKNEFQDNDDNDDNNNVLLPIATKTSTVNPTKSIVSVKKEPAKTPPPQRTISTRSTSAKNSAATAMEIENVAITTKDREDVCVEDKNNNNILEHDLEQKKDDDKDVQPLSLPNHSTTSKPTRSTTRPSNQNKRLKRSHRN